MQDKQELRKQMLRMIADWQASGLKQKEYCVAHDIAYHVFHYWYGVYRSSSSTAEGFVPVKIAPAGNGQQVTITGTSGIKLELTLNDAMLPLVQQLLRG